MQYGTNLEALAVSLNTVGMVSINRTHEILSGVFGVPISTGTISAMVSECAEILSKPVQEIKEAIIEEPLVHSDETGVRVDKKTMWAHVVSTEKLTYIEVQENRGKKGINAMGVLLAFVGTLIHDCWAAYFSYSAIRHGLCNAHLLRELVAVAENTQQEWAQKLIDLLLDMKHTKERLVSQGHSRATPYYLKKYALAIDAVLAEALDKNPVPIRDPAVKGRIKRGKTGALVDRLILHKEKFTLFFSDFNVPFDNNQAERDIRMFKVKQKVSGCFRTIDGAKDFAAISSFVGTARKHNISGFTAIKNAILGKPFSLKTSRTTE
jgi:transposase